MALEPANRRRIWKLAALLRIADGLDRGHYANVAQLKTITRRDTISIRLFTQTDPALELWAARHKTDMFELAYDRLIKFTARPLKAPRHRRRHLLH
jgi:exopolyphosphatase / guanosine-5'-triphosphate,3'-diphosphate pyrophosphatase